MKRGNWDLWASVYSSGISTRTTDVPQYPRHNYTIYIFTEKGVRSGTKTHCFLVLRDYYSEQCLRVHDPEERLATFCWSLEALPVDTADPLWLEMRTEFNLTLLEVAILIIVGGTATGQRSDFVATRFQVIR